MYNALAVRGTGALEFVVFAREWSRPLWGMLTILWMVAMVILFFTYISPNGMPPTATFNGLEFNLDKVFHVVIHAGTIALPLAIVPRRGLAWTMAGIAIFCGVAFEFAQLYVPERTFDLSDLTANFLGMAVGARSGRFVRELYPRLP